MSFVRKYPCPLVLMGIFVLSFMPTPSSAYGQQAGQNQESEELKLLRRQFENLQHRLDVMEKLIDDVLWYHRVGDVCHVDKVRIIGPPNPHVKNPKAMCAKNPIKFYSYVFIPKDIDRSKKYPLLVLPHGGVHADFTTYHTHIIRELMAQHYIVIAPEYRGSTGYGRSFYELMNRDELLFIDDLGLYVHEK